MPVPDFVLSMVGWRGGYPNIADRDSMTSVAIAAEMYSMLGVTHENKATGQQGGRALEVGVEEVIAAALPARDTHRQWTVDRRRRITDFAQYSHLAQLNQLVEADHTGTLSVEIGRDYLISPDVTVGMVVEPDRAQVPYAAESRGDFLAPRLISPEPLPFLHAAISCKLTIRSDRVQNIRHEGIVLTRHRRGRQPHIVTVTAEPLPSRLAAIARGTGEVDGVYHVCFEELVAATAVAGTTEQQQVLEETIGQGRLAPFDSLIHTLLH